MVSSLSDSSFSIPQKKCAYAHFLIFYINQKGKFNKKNFVWLKIKKRRMAFGKLCIRYRHKPTAGIIILHSIKATLYHILYPT